MEIDKERNEYLEKVYNRKFEVHGLLVELGTLGVLVHPFKTVKLKREFKKIEEISRDISKMSLELADARRKVFHATTDEYTGATSYEEYIAVSMKNYINSHPIDEYGVNLEKKNNSKVLSFH